MNSLLQQFTTISLKAKHSAVKYRKSENLGNSLGFWDLSNGYIVQVQ